MDSGNHKEDEYNYYINLRNNQELCNILENIDINEDKETKI